ncbi:MAG: carbon-nitrogen hydrolase family protein, partial [Alphaproteobacteria bacterium]
LQTWVAEAADNGAELLVFPEYGSIELVSLFGEAVAKDIHAQLDKLRFVVPLAEIVYLQLSRAYECHIVSASIPVKSSDGRTINRARLYTPGGRIGTQNKLIMTRYEREEWGISAGAGAQVFDTEIGKIGICICYDSEFPLIARAMAEAGAEIIAVPSCTDTMAGFSRVRIGAMARALENQLYTIHASTVGPFASPAVETNIGTGAIYGPPDALTTPTGIIAEGELNKPGWVYADLDMEKLREVRARGEVLNARDWPEQAPHLSGPASVVSLCEPSTRIE